jgi:molybdopterin-binding protein
LQGVIKEVIQGATTTIVKIEVKNPAVITASITKEAAEDLGIKVGDSAVAIIKASEVIVGK